jgi:hypothetical protein
MQIVSVGTTMHEELLNKQLTDINQSMNPDKGIGLLL